MDSRKEKIYLLQSRNMTTKTIPNRTFNSTIETLSHDLVNNEEMSTFLLDQVAPAKTSEFGDSVTLLRKTNQKYKHCKYHKRAESKQKRNSQV